MRLQRSPGFAQFGNVRIHELQRVIELEANPWSSPQDQDDCSLSAEEMARATSQLVIVVCCMNEDISITEGVLSGIPHACLVILVSNSDRFPVDNYQAEVDMLRQF